MDAVERGDQLARIKMRDLPDLAYQYAKFLSTKYASPVYELFDLDGMPVIEMPALSRPAMGTIGYHIRPGKHDVTVFDWDQYVDFANKHFRN